MPEMTSVPDAERPIGRFITEQVLPKWESMNSFPVLYQHNRVVNRTLSRHAIQVREMGELDAAFLHNGKLVGGRLGRETTLVSDQAAEACSVKSLTRAYWNTAGVPTMQAERFQPEEPAAASQFVASTASPVVIKPDGGRRGLGASIRVTSGDFQDSWNKARRANRRSPTGNGVLVEEFRDALCLRFFVVGGRVRGVTLRVPLFVVGDGSSTVQRLLEESFTHQQRNVLLRRTRPRISAKLVASTGLSLEDVPASGSLHILNENPHLLLGSLPCDVTAQVSPGLNDLACEAVLAIPGLGAAGIDVLTPSLSSAEGAVALDADSSASLHMHRHPAIGAVRAVGASIAHQLRLRADHWDRPVYSGSAQYAESPDE